MQQQLLLEVQLVGVLAEEEVLGEAHQELIHQVQGEVEDGKNNKEYH